MQAKQIKKGLPGFGAIRDDSINRNKQEVTSYPQNKVCRPSREKFWVFSFKQFF